jgi:hypothetical protein
MRWVEPAAEPSTGLVDVTGVPLAELRRNPTARQVEQARRIIDELLVVVPSAQEQVDYPFTTSYRDH